MAKIPSGTMDRCRCKEYSEAVKKLKVFTPGTLKSQLLEQFDKSGFIVTWVRCTASWEDLNFSKPKAYKIKQPMKHLEHDNIKQMWCPYRTSIGQK